MSWATERLGYLNLQQSYSQISANTGIPNATISYVINGQRNLPNKYHKSLRNYYQRSVYSDLKDAGFSSTQARRFSWYSPNKVLNVIEEITNVISQLANSRFEQYKDHLISTGQYIDDQSTMEILTSAIRHSLQNSDLPEERFKAMEYRNTNEL